MSSANDSPDRPLIGVTTSEVRMANQVEQTPQGEPPKKEMALGLTYMRAVELAGGLPVVIPPLPVEAIAPLLANLARRPAVGRPGHPPGGLRRVAAPRAGADVARPRPHRARARARGRRPGMPILAICRGAQALNVARGGTLFQHLPDRFGRATTAPRPGRGRDRRPPDRDRRGQRAQPRAGREPARGQLLPPPVGERARARTARRGLGRRTG